MFKLRIRNLNETYGGGKENLAADFLQAIGFLGTDGPRTCLLYTSPSPRDLSTSRMPSSA